MLSNEQIDPQRYYRELARKQRPDGRSLDEFRPVSVNVNSLTNADGSAVVKIGNTVVICGIKAELAKPKAESPDQGSLIPNVELPPLCSSAYQPGPPSDTSQVAAKFLHETLKNSNCIDLQDLCIVPDILSWVLYLDVVCLNQDGSLLDACIMAAVAGLQTVKLPEVTYNTENNEKTINLSRKKDLRVNSFPSATSFAIFENNTILSDPTMQEESFSTGNITIVVRAESGDLCGIHHPGSEPLKPEELQTCIFEAQKKAFSVAELINVAIKSPER